MSSITHAASATEPDRRPTDSAGTGSLDIPSGLASLIVHFSLLIVIGLFYFEPPAEPLSQVTVEWTGSDDADQIGGGGGPDEMGHEQQTAPELAPMLASAESELAAPLSDEISEFAVEPASFESATPELPMLDVSTDVHSMLTDLAAVGKDGLRGAGSGGGTGGGKGRGDGTGYGDRSGPSSSTSMFGVKDEGARILFVFDRSDSMNSVFTLTTGGKSVSVTPLDAAKAELMKSLNDLAPEAEFQIVFYNDVPAAFPDPYAQGGISHANPQTKSLAQSFVYGMIAERDTNHMGGLEMALALKPDVVFLMTDAEAKDDLSSAQVRNFEKVCRRIGARINVIHFCYEPRTNSTLIGLAEKTGGKFKTILIRSLVDPDWREDRDEN
jgi:hypothetical protein